MIMKIRFYYLVPVTLLLLTACATDALMHSRQVTQLSFTFNHHIPPSRIQVGQMVIFTTKSYTQLQNIT